MPKLKANRLSGVTHATKAKLTWKEDDGSTASGEFTVVYRGMSPKVARGLSESVADESNRVEMAKYLDATVVSLPEVVGDDEQPVVVSFEFFDAMEIENLRAVFNAVSEGYNPNAQPPVS